MTVLVYYRDGRIETKEFGERLHIEVDPYPSDGDYQVQATEHYGAPGMGGALKEIAKIEVVL